MIKKIENNVAAIMRHYGLGEAEARIVSILAARGDMNAKDVSARTGYAYSTVINSLNFLRRMGLVEKYKKGRLSYYSASIDFVEIMEDDRKRIMSMFHELKKDIEGLKEKYKKRLKKLVENVERSIKYMKEREETR